MREHIEGTEEGTVMTLVFDNRNELQGRPGLHTLIAGVSFYPHFLGGAGVPAPESFGITQLSSSVLTAYKMYRWVLERQSHFPVPLATCRLLLSPSPVEAEVEPNLHSLTEACTRNNFETAAYEWRTDASLHKDSMTLFYFAGHGIQFSRAEAIVLLEDFGDGRGGLLRNAVSINNLFDGMAPTAARPNVALTQLYFIDASRVLPSRFRDFERITVPDVFSIELRGFDERSATIFYAAAPGGISDALRGEQTVFSRALLQCLNGAAGEVREQETGQEQWYVSINSLREALVYSIHELNQATGAEQDFITRGGVGDAVIHYLDRTPLVDLVLQVDPPDALPFTRVEIMDDIGNPIITLPMPLNPHPYKFKLPAGFYSISAKIDPPIPHFMDFRGRIRPVMPPRYLCKVKVTAS